MTVSDRICLFLLLAALVSCSDKLNNEDTGDMAEITYTPDLTSLVRNPVSGWTLYDDANDEVADAEYYWDAQDLAARRFASIFYWRGRWAELEPQEGVYAWDVDENFKALLQGALDRGLKLAFCVYVDGQDNIRNGTPDFVREAGAQGYPVHRLWDPEGVDNNWTPYVDDPVFQEKFSNFIRAFAEKFDDPDIVDYVDAFNLGWWGEGHHIQYLNPSNKANVFKWITELYGSSFSRVILVTNFGTEMGLEVERKLAVQNQGYVIRRNSLASVWFQDTELRIINNTYFPHVPFIAECGYWGGNEDTYQPWLEDNLYKDVFTSWVDVYQQAYKDAIMGHANTLDLREVRETRGWTRRALDLVKDFVSKGGYRMTPVSMKWTDQVGLSSEVRIRHTWRNSGVGVCPNNNRRWNYKYKVSFALYDPVKEKIAYRYVDEKAEPSAWLYGSDTEYESVFVPDVARGKYELLVCIADTSKEDVPPGISLAVKNPQMIQGWLKIGELTIQ